mmetsp:Transcript_20454/g.30949  ORF Transcript_20454/g.30949 Transcript_20454/m.30949 type:complete len:187 (+) Transcript_20454:201-761(+)
MAQAQGNSPSKARATPPHFDPDDCNNPACSSQMEMMKKALGSVKFKEQEKPEAHSQRAEGSLLADQEKRECPATKDELGKASWTLLHTMAAYYPDQPSDVEQQMAQSFISSLAAFYPCSWCAKDFQKKIVQFPPCVENRECFSKWMCMQHNLVNKKLGKAKFDCRIEKLDERWKIGMPACWGETNK